MIVPEHCGAVLTIDLDAIIANYRLLTEKSGKATCAAVVKADAYGLGMAKVAPALAAAGCSAFFVATIDEGIELRNILADVSIYILNGPAPDSAPVFAEHRLTPVLNSLGNIEAWTAYGDGRDAPLPAVIHVDTGMSRLGLSPREMEVLADKPERLANVKLAAVMSHLACADEPDHEMNRRQLTAFRRAPAQLPKAPASLANSSGIFLGADYCFDMTRPGAALYGISPIKDNPNPMAQVVRLQGKILQIRDVDTPLTVGYGATCQVGRGGRIATVAAGYADGYLRSLSNRGCGFIGNYQAPVIGRVSMDIITLDVSEIPRDAARPGIMVDLIGPLCPVDEVARRAGTIGYEILTGLGARYHRVYCGGKVSA